MHLTDGRVVDLTGLSIEEVFAVLAREQITPDQILETRHILNARAFRCYRCPRCGRVSYNRNDVAQRYCGACHRFEGDEPGASAP